MDSTHTFARAGEFDYGQSLIVIWARGKYLGDFQSHNDRPSFFVVFKRWSRSIVCLFAIFEIERKQVIIIYFVLVAANLIICLSVPKKQMSL